nr:M10 family metallopeptidase C-terminal domain-containing protein [uncultured Sphingomonas sp.]
MDASLDPQAGGTAAGKPIWTAAQVAAHLNRTGAGWKDGFNDSGNEGLQNNIGDDNQTITYGFFDTQTQVFNNGYVFRNATGGLSGYSEYFGFAAFTADQRAATREAMQSWDDVAAVSFREVSADEADINFGNLTNAPNTQAYAYLPQLGFEGLNGGQSRELGGDVWVSVSQASNFQLDEGGYGLQTLVHEAGHALGLSHPGAYNAGSGGPITYPVNAEYAQDTRAYSVMSYFQASVLGARHFDFNISTTVYSGVPLIHDILAIQRMYGADMTTRTGDTTYGFNSNAGRDSFDFDLTPAPVMAIWDAGGNDTIDASKYATRQLIDLTPGSLSSIGGVTFENAPSYEQVLANRTAAGISNATFTKAIYEANMAALQANPDVGRLTDNVGIAYGVIIENAIGGSGADTIIGNTADNVLKGNGGDDLINGWTGNDKLYGGDGSDELYGGDGNDDLYGDAGDDVLYGDAGNDKLYGDAGDDVLFGGAGSDRLFGGAGNDRLVGGDGRDFLTGGSGADIFVAERDSSAPVKGSPYSTDTFLDFVSGTDKIDLSAFNFAGIELTGIGANKDAGDVSFRVFTSVKGAETALGFDIDGIDGAATFKGSVTVVYINVDGGAPDIALSLFGSSGVTLNDFIINSAPASVSATNAQLFGLGTPVGGEFTFA